MTEMNDEGLRERFSALRELDRQTEPDFASLRNRAALRASQLCASQRPRFATPLLWAAAAAVIVAAVVGIGRVRDHDLTTLTVTWVHSISDWQSPTAGLLQTPATSVLVSRPLLSSVFDGVTNPLQLKTD